MRIEVPGAVLVLLGSIGAGAILDRRAVRVEVRAVASARAGWPAPASLESSVHASGALHAGAPTRLRDGAAPLRPRWFPGYRRER